MTIHTEAGARPPKPATLPFKGLPSLPALDGLRSSPRWVAWDHRYNEEREAWVKMPINPHTGGNASSTGSSTWGTCEAALARTAREKLAGVGFVVTGEDGLIGIDLDSVVDPETGLREPWVEEVLGFAETYTEVSPSGTGIRILARGELEASVAFKPARVEVYRDGRYLTVTGRHVEGTPAEIRPAPRTLAFLLARVETIRAEVEAARRAERAEGLPNGHAANGARFGKAVPGWNGGDFFSSVNSLALDRLSGWVPALFGSVAVYQPGTQGYRVTSHSLGRNLEEDLSITPGGITDWGVHDMGDPRDGGRSAVDVVIEHGGASDPSAAALWLCDRLGVDPASLGWRGKGSGEERKAAGSAGAKLSASPGECLPLFPPLPPAEPYPVEALGPLGPAGVALARKVQVPPALAAQSVLAAASLAVQAHADVVLPFGQTRPLSLFLVTVAASGDRKSSADAEALWPVRKCEKALAEEREEDLKTYRIDKAAWEAERRRIEGDKKLDFEGRREALRFLGEEPEPPLHAFLTAADPTIEGLAKAWPNAHPALGIFTAEGGQFTGGHAMSDDSRLRSAAALSDMWDGTPIKRARALDGVSILPGRRLAMHLMLQPDAAADFLAHPVLRNQGLLSRVLVAAPDSLAGRRPYRDATPDEDGAVRAYGKRLLGILEARPAMTEGKRNELDPRPLPLSAEAARLWRAFHDHVEGQLLPGGALVAVQGLAAKAAEHAARIAGVLTLAANLGAAEIGEGEMRDGIALADWYLAEAVRLQAAGRTDPALLQARDLLDWLQGHGDEQGHVAFRDVLRLGPSGTRKLDAAEAALKVLARHGWTEEVSGRPRVIRVWAAREGGGS